MQQSWAEFLLSAGQDSETSQIYGWKNNLGTFQTEFDRIYAELKKSIPDYNSRHLVHSDLINRNVLFDKGRITAVLDWGSALYGDYMYDLAWLLFYDQYVNGLSPDFKSVALEGYRDSGLDTGSADERIRACQLHIGLDSIAYNSFRNDPDGIKLAIRLVNRATGI
ncbi:MAG: Hygromycin-B 4-O-kinase [candidate division WS6 bacterium OLB20]|uniref:Hygromycin-B 4-O-kinase n=1 Tax=candidate division WS6 bacterium OLB20 TaxID=1617426 RepID=A0A136M0D7_9BACT|nr:MAG: Hygromycin-B 4-O-kinase [candidate division WS6 bacterium OLB20]